MSSQLSSSPNLSILSAIPLLVSIRFGTAHLTLQELLNLNAGGIVNFIEQVNEPVELLVGGKVVARGDVVIVDGCYGLQISELISGRG